MHRRSSLERRGGLSMRQPFFITHTRLVEQMLEVGLHNHVDAIEETAVVASKEYSLEKALDRMEDEFPPKIMEHEPGIFYRTADVLSRRFEPGRR